MKKLRHESLVAWQRADDLFIELHQLALALPAHERFELGSQMRRAGYSVAANIVEGMSRRYRRARLHFLNIAEGSLAEASYCVHVAARLGYITQASREELDAHLKAAGAPLIGLIRSTRLMPLVVPILGAFTGAALVLLAQPWLR
jgi:four helix bundle protein